MKRGLRKPETSRMGLGGDGEGKRKVEGAHPRKSGLSLTSQPLAGPMNPPLLRAEGNFCSLMCYNPLEYKQPALGSRFHATLKCK